MKKRIHSIFFYALLLGVYGTFFSVESFYNFEGQPDGKGLTRSQAFTRPGIHNQPAFKNTPTPSSASRGFRLNKRYHQENIPPYPIFSLAAPERRIAPLRLGFDNTGMLPAIAILHYSLRGPPTAA
jgi:hypothetical protein